ncbi:16S rRNA (cytidine(1402)-2'-O)-methyltransferase [Phaeovulum vinaykumarii]|uniref:Ribosomal RNA small subunit methyltransferase I n=1 Tax=Phaeovulum vinaykumarii TaxID=407234 RepID=A0A1N7L3E2_9RHOB|nr:16S rRNA (cytidine(1402)-2'-O)-methyltransferase [Phaeovulum vinaykumarii]SIS68190.1 16S rRNA (cytidine1402-2'-O)-methyltransferase [Phaeovulum vinaykumarii]SOC00239.1 16S rRNA (cytidine1402-2'-O)-methyltransferase [Phaeovulum vinaykumarii]
MAEARQTGATPPPEGQATPRPDALRPPAPGLHFIATPIGTARDITLRALDLLRSAEVIAAEDTRSLRQLMEIHGVPLGHRPMIAYHDHNGAAARPRLMAALAEGRSVVYASEAGTPLVADPGYQLAREAREAGFAVHVAPGPSAVLAALTVSGLPTDRFLFAGFAPRPAGARKAWLAEIGAVPATLVIYESPRRLGGLLNDMCQSWGEERIVAVCRELTKRFEEVRRGPLGQIAADYADAPPKGEIVVVVDRPQPRAAAAEDVEDALRAALARLRVKDAATEVARALDLPRRDVYQLALRLGAEARGNETQADDTTDERGAPNGPSDG